MTDLIAYRDRFPILRDCTYLINHSLAAMPAAAEGRLLEYARMWRERGIRSWGEGWWEMPVTVGDQIGRIIGAPPGSTVMHQNVTVAEEVVLSCFRQPGARNRVVYEEANFPSVRYLYQAKPDLEVSVVEDDYRALSAQFEGDVLDRVRRQPHDLAPDRRRAGEGDLVDAGMAGQVGADLFAHAGDDVEHTGGQTAFLGHLGEEEHGQRRLLVGLDDDGVPGRQGRPDLPER